MLRSISVKRLSVASVNAPCHRRATFFSPITVGTYPLRPAWLQARLSTTSAGDAAADGHSFLGRFTTFQRLTSTFPRVFKSLLSPKAATGWIKQPPPQVLQSLLDRLERTYYCATRAGDQNRDELIRGTWGMRLRRAPSKAPDALGAGLFLTEGKVRAGQVITLYPGTIYKMPYDLESLIPTEFFTMAPRPPEFIRENDYLLRFFHKPTNQHVLIDGCPRGQSALNFIKAAQRRRCFQANVHWLEASSKLCSVTAATMAQCPTELEGGPCYFRAYIAHGHMIQRHVESMDNVEFHLIELPADLPKHLKDGLVPNVHYSDRLGPRHFAVVVTAARDLEASLKGDPVELLVAYGRDPHRFGYPLR